MRLDQFLVLKKMASTRTQAQALIQSGAVEVFTNNQWVPITKPSYACHESDEVRLKDTELTKFVSRAGLKLQGALESLGLRISDFVCLDVGQSTGGFTDCLLQHGASRVVGIDVGQDQLHPVVKNNPQVRSFEGLNAKNLKNDLEFLAEAPKAGFDLIVIDVSFISLEQVLPEVISFLGDTGKLLALVKPQFEVGPEGLGKGGIVKSSSSYQAVQNKIERKCHELGLNVLNYFPSQLPGKDGNREFFIYCHKATDSKFTDDSLSGMSEPTVKNAQRSKKV